MVRLNQILLIDDNEADNDYHELVVRRADIANRLTTINSSIKALDYFNKCLTGTNTNEYPLPDLVFLDINMPALNGFELLDKIRRLPDPEGKKAKLKIYMLTGSLNPDDLKRATTEYADVITGFRIKPLSDTIFCDIISKHYTN
jgi:CheY-like chemotaxis protein